MEAVSAGSSHHYQNGYKENKDNVENGYVDSDGGFS